MILSCQEPTIRALEKFTFRKGGKPTNVLPLAKGEGRRKALTTHRLNDQMRTETLRGSPAWRSHHDPCNQKRPNQIKRVEMSNQMKGLK